MVVEAAVQRAEAEVRDAKAALERAKAALKRAEAASERAEAASERAEAALERAEAALEKHGPVFLPMYQSAQATLQSVQATLQSAHGMVQSAHGMLQSAIKRLNDLEASVVSGLLGRRGVTDFVDTVTKQLIEAENRLPTLAELGSYIKRPLNEEERFPVVSSIYEALRGADISAHVFRQATSEDGFLKSTWFAMNLQSPPVPTGSEDSFHFFWDLLIFAPISRFLDDYGICNTRNESGVRTTGITRCDSTYYLGGHALLKGEEKGLATSGDPAQELVDKGLGPYFDSVPYVLGYWARGYKLVLCALYRSGSLATTRRIELMELNLDTLRDRIRLFLACFHLAKILRLLKSICVRNNVQGDEIFQRPNGKVVQLLGSQVKKSFQDTEQAGTVVGTYEAIRGCPNAEQVLHSNPHKQYIITNRGCGVRPSNAAELSKCISSVLTALAYLHGRNIMHRDVRWDNVMKYKDQDSWFLIDFDEACISPCAEGHSRLNKANHAPEISGPHSVKVDIWGVGYLIKTSHVLLLSSALEHIRDLCLAESPSERPTADECLFLLQTRKNETLQLG